MVRITIKTASMMILGVCVLAIASSIPATQSSMDVLANGDFETGTLDGWEVGGACTISNTIIHNGSYSAYISDYPPYYNNWIRQTPILSADSSYRLEGWVYPLKVGSLGNAQYPDSGISFWFCNKSSMLPAFYVNYLWCWGDSFNGSAPVPWVNFLLSFNMSQWNYLSRNVTQDLCSHFAGVDLSELVLYNMTIEYHFSNGSPGAFYLDDLKLLNEQWLPTEINDVHWFPTCPRPYVFSIDPRVNEPILIKANVTGTDIETVTLKFRRQGTQWFNVSMLFNATENLWVQTMLGQSDNCTIEFFIDIMSTYVGRVTSGTYQFYVKPLPLGDINGDGKVRVEDVLRVALNFGTTYP